MIYGGEYLDTAESRFTLILREGEVDDTTARAMRGLWVHELMVPEDKLEEAKELAFKLRGMHVGALMTGKITTYK